MAAHPTSSFRAPPELHSLVHSVARALTRRPDLAEALRALLETVAEAPGPIVRLPDLHDLVRRLEALERVVTDHAAMHAAPPAAERYVWDGPQPEAPEAKTPSTPVTEPKSPEDTAPPDAEPGRRPYHRATEADRKAVLRRHKAGERTEDIATAVGVSPATARRIIAAARVS